MKIRSTNELFALFFDPKVPAAFTIGTLAVAVAGSALSELLKMWLGTSPLAQGILFIGSLLVVALSVLILRQAVHFWLRHQERSKLVVPEHQQVPGLGGLILPLGVNPGGAEQAIIVWHVRRGTLRHCWLLVSPEARDTTKFGNIKQWLQEQNVEVHTIDVEDVYQAAASYRATLQALDEAQGLERRGAWPALVDVTSGTAVMSVGIALAARERGAAIQYYPTRYAKQTGSVVPDAATAPLLVAEIVVTPEGS